LACHYRLDPVRIPQSLFHFEQAVRLKPDLADAWYNMGIIHQHRNDFSQAHDAFVRALAIRPSYWEAHLNLGVLYSDRGRFGEALEQFKAARRWNAYSFECWFNMGNAQMNLGRPREAAASYREALRIRPGDPCAKTNLETALRAELGRADSRNP